MKNDKKKNNIIGHAVVKISGEELQLLVNSINTIINVLNNKNQVSTKYNQLLKDFKNIKAEYDKKEKEYLLRAKRPKRK